MPVSDQQANSELAATGIDPVAVKTQQEVQPMAFELWQRRVQAEVVTLNDPVSSKTQ